MRKRHSTKRDEIIDRIKKTHSSPLLVEHIDRARLQFPEKFPENPSRLYRKLQENCIIALEEFILLLNNLPDTYKARIFTHHSFEPFVQTLLSSSLSVQKKNPQLKKSLKQNSSNKQIHNKISQTFPIYVANIFLNHSLNYIIKSMPDAFQDNLKNQIYPFVLSINSITDYVASTKTQRDIPYVSIPYDLYPSNSVPPRNFGIPQ